MTEKEFMKLSNLLMTIIREIDIEMYDHSYEIEDKIDSYADQLGVYRYGASKHCIVLNNYPFVIKWMKGDSEENNEAVQEANFYQKAKAENLEFFFPYTRILGEHNGITFVIQEKIDFAICDLPRKYRNHYAHMTENQSEKLPNKMSNEIKYGINPLWAKMVILLYGRKNAKALCQFLRQYHINDLHNGNIGFQNNKPIILDFAGYHRKNNESF